MCISYKKGAAVLTGYWRTLQITQGRVLIKKKYEDLFPSVLPAISRFFCLPCQKIRRLGNNSAPVGKPQNAELKIKKFNFKKTPYMLG
jgi:hypothetical protein